MSLTDEDIKQRLIRLRNLELLYAKARERIALLESENKRQKERIAELEKNDRDKNTKIEAFAFQLEQINNKVFGKQHVAKLVIVKHEHQTRSTESYLRPLPKTVTGTKKHPVRVCLHCTGRLTRTAVRTFYEEDIPLPIIKTVIKHEVEVGYCPSCRRQSAGCPIPPKTVILGANVNKYVCLLSTVNRLSHRQIQEHLKDVFDLSVSLGEIGNMLKGEADKLRPEYERLKKSVTKQQATHYDETSWPVAKEEHGTFGWLATGTENNDAVFLLGRSRGKGNIEELGVADIGISDDYGGYRNTFPEHQLCFAHPQRKLRDLAQSAALPEETRKQCEGIYRQFSSLYRRIRQSLGTRLSPYLKRKLKTDFDQIAETRTLDPIPLAQIKTALRKNREKYFTFLRHPGIPADNNKAERALRHLVLKRKISFGSKTQRGAETLSVLASVMLSLKWNDPQNWFKSYLSLKP